MISSPDFITLEYSDDLTQAGIAYGLRSLPYFQRTNSAAVAQRLRLLAAFTGVELAFKRYLVNHHIPHEVWSTRRFANPEDCDLGLGGRACALVTTFLKERNLIHKVHQAPDTFLSAQVAVPSTQVPCFPQARDKIYVFAFLTGLVADTRPLVARAVEAGHPVYLLHPLPSGKFRSEYGQCLDEISLKCDTPEPVSITLGGQDPAGAFQTERLDLMPRSRFVISKAFRSLSTLRVEEWPDGVVGLHCSGDEGSYLISQSQWENIWVYGMKIFFVGYLPGEIFAKEAQRLPPGNRTFAGEKTLVENLVYPVRELRPMQELFDRTVEWECGE